MLEPVGLHQGAEAPPVPDSRAHLVWWVCYGILGLYVLTLQVSTRNLTHSRCPSAAAWKVGTEAQSCGALEQGQTMALWIG